MGIKAELEKLRREIAYVRSGATAKLPCKQPRLRIVATNGRVIDETGDGSSGRKNIVIRAVEQGNHFDEAGKLVCVQHPEIEDAETPIQDNEWEPIRELRRQSTVASMLIGGQSEASKLRAAADQLECLLRLAHGQQLAQPKFADDPDADAQYADGDVLQDVVDLRTAWVAEPAAEARRMHQEATEYQGEQARLMGRENRRTWDAAICAFAAGERGSPQEERIVRQENKPVRLV